MPEEAHFLLNSKVLLRRVFPSLFNINQEGERLGPRLIFPVSDTSRYIHHEDNEKTLVYVGGVCKENEGEKPVAGWAFQFGFDRASFQRKVVAGRLENHGTTGERVGPSANRATLRAIYAALRYRHWEKDGFNTLVLAVGPEAGYIVRAAVTLVKGWISNGWKAMNGQDVEDRDL
ncbi:hypothetical protein M426DRAFT_24389 [Hypoxylon sp. CI-4A]|nr:hypothetical protein M426DRAFT_24389 [Hypoxylon sp. CI-4A]